MNISKIITVVGILIVATGIGYLAYQHSSVNLLPDKTIGWDTYTNEKYGFELKFPESWDGYKVSENDYPDYSYVGFSFTEPHRPFIIFQVVRYSKQQWESLRENVPLTLLNQLDDSVLVCDGCCKEDDYEFQGGGQFDKFQTERCKEAYQIIKTFKVLK